MDLGILLEAFSVSLGNAMSHSTLDFFWLAEVLGECQSM